MEGKRITKGRPRHAIVRRWLKADVFNFKHKKLENNG
jgi:hypothetical protein